MSIDHISIGVLDIKKSRAFYDAVLEPLGLRVVMPVEVGGQTIALGYGGADGHPTFWVQLPYNRQPASAGNGAHIAFRAPNRAAVDAFYLAALDHGGIDDGKPGIRHDYHPNYYGAFVRDPIGNKIEACCHDPE